MKNKQILSLFLTFLIFILFAYYFVTNVEKFSPLLGVPWYLLLGIAILTVISFYIRGILYKLILKSYSTEITIQDGFLSSFITSVGNYFFPMQTGSAARAVFFKRKYDFPYDKFISGLSGIFVVAFFASSALGFVAAVILHVYSGVFSSTLYIVLGSILLSTLILPFIELPKFSDKKRSFSFLEKLLNKINDVVDGWNILIKDKKLLFKLGAVTLLDYIILAGSIYLQFLSIGKNLNIVQIILYTSLSAFAVLVNFTPAAIGFQEAIYIFFSNTLGITSLDVLQVAIIGRGVLFFTLVIGMIIMKVVSPDLFSVFSKKESNNNEK